MNFVKNGICVNLNLDSIFNQKENFSAYLMMMIKRTKVWTIVGLMFASIWSFGQSIDQVINDLDAERYTAALAGANKLVESSPSVETYFLKGYTILNSPDYTKPENLKAAQQAFEAGNALERKGDPLNQVGLGMVKLASKDLAGGKAILEEVKKDTKYKKTDILYRVAEAYSLFPEANDPAQAILDIDMAIDKSKVVDNPEYYFVKADAYMLKNDGGNAMNALNNAERLGKKLDKTYAKMSKIWLQSRNYKDANDVINKGIAVNPKFAPIYKYQSSYMQTFGDFAKSAEAASNYLKNSDGDVNAKLRYAKLAFIAKDYISLKRVLGEIKGQTNDPYIYRMEGIVNFEEGRHEQAIKDFEKFIQANPKDENFGLDYGYIGRAYLMMDGEANENKGIENIEKAVALKDSSMNYYEVASEILTKKGNTEKAAELFEKSVVTNPKANASDFATVATNYFRARNWEKADVYFDRALDLYKDQWPVGYALSGFSKTYRYAADSTKNSLYLGAPSFEKYLALLGDAGKKDPNQKSYVVAALKTLAGRDFLRNNDVNAAKAKIEEVLILEPTDADAQGMLHRFNKIIDPKYVIPTTPADSTSGGN